MKQHITLKQWDELTKEQKKVLWNNGFKNDWKMNIGQMIEFLGDDDYPNAMCEEWGDGLDVPKDYIGVPVNELCDKLWEATKNKLKTKTMNKKYTKAIFNDFDIEYNVRKMSNDEIDNDDCQYYCDDETGHIFKKTELTFS